MSKFIRRWGLLIITVMLVLLVDQGAKQFVLQSLELGESWAPIPAISDFIRVTRSYNTGAAFGMLPFASPFFLVLALVTVVVFIISYPHLPSQAFLSRFSMALIIGGALSNAVDRLQFGHVVDYVHVRIGPNLANISNFADHAITVGVVILLIDQWVFESRRVAQEKAASAAEAAEISPETEAAPLPPENSTASPDVDRSPELSPSE